MENIIETISYIVVFLILGFFVYYLYCCYFNQSELKCIVSGVNGNKYCVRERSKLKEKEAVDLLAKTIDKCTALVDYVYEKFPDEELCKMLKKNFNPKSIKESLPTSTLTAYTENKGESMSFCLNVKKENNSQLIDENTLLFVAIHELSHCGTTSIGHKTDFWENFKFLLEQSKILGIYHPVDYKNSPTEYCSMKLSDNPYYDFVSSKE